MNRKGTEGGVLYPLAKYSECVSSVDTGDTEGGVECLVAQCSMNNLEWLTFHAPHVLPLVILLDEKCIYVCLSIPFCYVTFKSKILALYQNMMSPVCSK